ncbi:MAG: ArnT family glycosyltransferase [Elusimicrobiota bacterium]
MNSAESRKKSTGRAFVLILSAACGLWGIRWGLPGSERLKAFPRAVSASPQFSEYLAKSWQRLYRKIHQSHQDMASEEPITYVRGVVSIPPGWILPPPALINSCRSFLLQSENPDEKKSFIILSQMRPWRLDFEPLYAVYGGAFTYPLGAFLAASSALKAIVLVPGVAHYLEHPTDMASLYIGGRVFILLFQILSVWIIYDLACSLSGWETGLTACLFFIFCPAVIVQSHILKPHPYAAFWCLAVLSRAVSIFEQGRRRDYWLCGLALGMAVGSEFSLACFGVIPILAWAMRPRKEKHGKPHSETFWMLQAVALSIALCVAINPYLLLAYRDFAWEMTVYMGHGSSTLLASIEALARAGTSELGIVLSLMMPCALIAAMLVKNQKIRLAAAASFCVFICLWVGLTWFWGFSSSTFVLRYYYALIGPLCIIAADFACGLPRAAKVILIAAAIFEGGIKSLVYLENMGLDSTNLSTRSVAADWINRNIPAGSSVGLSRYPEPAHTPPFQYSRYRLVVFDKPSSLSRAQYPDYIVLDVEAEEGLRSWMMSRYARIKAFLPWTILGFHADDASFYANTAMYVYKRIGHS